MSITLNGSTGITTPDIDSVAAPDLDGSNITGIATAAQGALADTALQSSSPLTAANLTGTLPAIDGSALTGVGTSTDLGAVGTYAWACLLPNGSSGRNITEGITYSGSILKHHGGVGGSSTQPWTTTGTSIANGRFGTSLSGTWRAMGHADAGTKLYTTSIFVRIS